MQAIKKYTFLITLAIFLLHNGKAQGFLKARGTRLVNAKGENMLLRGMGLGGWMLQEGYMLGLTNGGQQHAIRARIEQLISKEQAQEFYDAWQANHTRRIDIDSLKAWGFNSIRLPMHYNLYTLPVEKEPVAGRQTWLSKGFAMTDSLLAWCKANKLYLILDLHAAPGGQGNDLNIADRDPAVPALWENEANRQKTIALWKKLAARYAHEPFIGGYDLLNETNWGFQDSANDKHGLQEKQNAPLKKLLVDITAAIRSVDRNHLIIIEGNGWGNNYKGMLPAWDGNMALSFHKYWNATDQQSIAHILKMRSQYHLPVWLGESGENSNTWFTNAIRLLERNNIGWAWWPLKKLGANNPLQIRTNHNYAALLAYWNGERPHPPKESDVYSGLLELAVYTRFETNIIHRDVIDAMMRQPFAASAVPFKTNLVKDSGTIQAVDYDLGSNGIAYFDTDTTDEHESAAKSGGGNNGHMYRNDGVDIDKDAERYETYFVTNTEDGEWLQYTIRLAQAGNYTLEFTVASDKDNGKINVHDGSARLLENMEVPNTGDMETWKVISAKPVALSAGRHILRVYIIKGGFNFRAVKFIANK